MDILSIVTQLGSGMLSTLSIFFLTLLFSLPLGLLVCLGECPIGVPFGNYQRIRLPANKAVNW